jgi:hypothetical protein
MNCPYPTSGLKAPKTVVTPNDRIQLEIDSHKIYIGDLADLYTLDSEYHNGTVTDPNGVEIQLDTLVDNIILTGSEARAILHKDTATTDQDTTPERLVAFEKILQKRVIGFIQER